MSTANQGEKLPLVFFPRFTSFTLDAQGSTAEFHTTPVDMLEYASIDMTFWRGAGVNLQQFDYDIQQSADLTNWEGLVSVPGISSGLSSASAAPTARYVRCTARVTPTGSGTVCALTTWAVGYVQRTEA